MCVCTHPYKYRSIHIYVSVSIDLCIYIYISRCILRRLRIIAIYASLGGRRRRRGSEPAANRTQPRRERRGAVLNPTRGEPQGYSMGTAGYLRGARWGTAGGLRMGYSTGTAGVLNRGVLQGYSKGTARSRAAGAGGRSDEGQLGVHAPVAAVALHRLVRDERRALAHLKAHTA